MDSEELFRMLIPLTGIVLGSLMFLIPIAGLTARFAIKPVLDAIRSSRVPVNAGELAALERRVALLEQHCENLETSLTRLSEAKTFERKLGAGA
ncbi:MAG: hypothetical protein ACRERX_12505 [Pseudomonas sp.]